MNRKKYSDSDLVTLWDTFNSLIHKYIKSDRIKQIDIMLDDINEQLTISPASTRYHGNYEGGLIEHLIDTIGAALYIRNFFVKMDVDDKRIPSIESCIFCAAFHDLGKIGDIGKEYYLPEKNDWQQKNRNKFFDVSKKMTNLHHSDGSLFLLSKYNISITREEWQAIMTHDGAYHPKNRCFEYENKVDFLAKIIRESDMLAYILQDINQFTDEELRN
jgi:hypothetical protein